MTSLISCQSVGYHQQALDILVDINWQLESGQHWAVLGPNGSGKTTLLRIACGYLWPTSGRVLRLGHELIDLSELRRSIGWISSDLVARIPARDTGLETVLSGRYAQIGLKRFAVGGPSESDFADAARELALLNCTSLADKTFGVLSQGEHQQVLIARAAWRSRCCLCSMSRVPAWTRASASVSWSGSTSGCAGSDAKSPTVVLVTHHVEEIVSGIQNTLILRAGHVHRAGPTPPDVVTRKAIEEVYRTRLSRIEQSGGRLWPIWDGSRT